MTKGKVIKLMFTLHSLQKYDRIQNIRVFSYVVLMDILFINLMKSLKNPSVRLDEYQQSFLPVFNMILRDGRCLTITFKMQFLNLNLTAESIFTLIKYLNRTMIQF